MRGAVVQSLGGGVKSKCLCRAPGTSHCGCCGADSGAGPDAVYHFAGPGQKGQSSAQLRQRNAVRRTDSVPQDGKEGEAALWKALPGDVLSPLSGTKAKDSPGQAPTGCPGQQAPENPGPHVPLRRKRVYPSRKRVFGRKVQGNLCCDSLGPAQQPPEEAVGKPSLRKLHTAGGHRRLSGRRLGCPGRPI